MQCTRAVRPRALSDVNSPIFFINACIRTDSVIKWINTESLNQPTNFWTEKHVGLLHFRRFSHPHMIYFVQTHWTSSVRTYRIDSVACRELWCQPASQAFNNITITHRCIIPANDNEWFQLICNFIAQQSSS